MVSPELFAECLRDSPKFRSQLAEQETQIELLENKIEKMLKLCNQMIDAGQTYVSHQSLFAHAVWELAGCFKQDTDITSALNRLVHALQEINKYHTILLDQATRTIVNNLSSFLKSEVQGVWDSRQHFNKISSDLDMALTKNSQASKTKPIELKEAQNLLQATSTCFRHNVLDHVHCVSMLQAKKKPEILGSFVSYLHACSTYFHQGSDLCEGLSPFLKQLNTEVGKLRDDAAKLEKKLGNRHNLVGLVDTEIITDLDTSEPMQGYLFKRTTNAFKSWHRRYFSFRDHKLVYRKRSGDEETVMEEDLKLCSVRPLSDIDRRYCFELISPSRSHILQADNEYMYNRWIEALQHGIGAALQQTMEVNHNHQTKDLNTNDSSTPSTSNKNKSRICEQLYKVAGNDVCCDCTTNKPTWASINLGITLCIECSGIHRSLGVHNSKVRSLTLDSWEPEVIKVMLELGNSVVNKVYESKLPQSYQRLSQTSQRSDREEFIKRKWIDREFVAGLVVKGGSPSNSNACRRKWSVRKLRRRGRSKDGKSSLTPTATLEIADEILAKTDDNRTSIVVVGDDESLPPSPVVDVSSDEDSTSGNEENTTTVGEEMCKLNPTVLLYKASAAHNLPVMCRALALSADKLWTNPEQNNMTHLHQAVRSGSVMACEYLVLNGVSMDVQDDLGRTPLYLAVHLGHTAQVCLLLKHKADQHLKDKEGKDPLDIAIDMAHADIVTLLRLGRLNEEMKETEAGDETFNDVVRDFSQMGNISPAKKTTDDSPSRASPVPSTTKSDQT